MLLVYNVTGDKIVTARKGALVPHMAGCLHPTSAFNILWLKDGS